MAETPFSSEPPAASGGDAAPAEAPPAAVESVEGTQGSTPHGAAPADEEAAPAADIPAAPEVPAAAAEPAPPAAPEPVPAAPAAGEPAVAATLEAPPTAAAPGEAAGAGGEWELLTGKLRDWLASGEFQQWWLRLQGPLKGLAYLIGLVLLLRVYGAVVGTIDRIPLVSGLLELAGLIALVRFTFQNLLKTSEREKVLASWRKRWQEFRGGA